MGFLKRLFGGGGGGGSSFDDRLWLTMERRWADSVARITEDARQGLVVCLAAYHFPDSGRELRTRLGAEGLEVDDLREVEAAPLASRVARLPTGTVGLIHSDELPQEVKRGEAQRPEAGGGRRCHVHMVEHHPMLYGDTYVLNLRALLPVGSSFSSYSALDEPWITTSGERSAVDLFRQLGMDESRPIAHAMVSTALSRAQEQLRQRLRKNEQPADSLEEWARLNITPR